MKARVKPLSRRELLREYPLDDLAADWFFKVEERSPGNFLVEGKDIWGRVVSKAVPGDPASTLDECVRDAMRISGLLNE